MLVSIVIIIIIITITIIIIVDVVIIVTTSLQAIDSEMTMLATEARDVERLRLELAGYFCEEEGSFKLDDCLGVVNSFCKHFLVAHEENKERKLMAEKAEMKRMERQKSLQRRMSAASGPSPTVFSTGERNGASVEIQNSPCPSNRFVHSTHNQLTQNRARSASCTRGSISEGLQHQQQQQFNGNGASDDCDDSHLLDVLLRPSFAGEKGFEARKFSSLRFNRRRSRNQAELWERERFSSPLGTEDRNSENRSSAPSPCALESPESRKNSALEVGADAKNDSATLALVRNGFARSSCPSRVQVSERQTGGRVCPTSETAGGSSTATAQPDPDEIRPRARNAVDSTTRTKTDLDRRLSREVAMGAASVEQQIRQLESSLSSFDGDLELDKTLGSRSRQNGCSRKNDAALKIPRIRLSSPERLEPKEDPTANGSNINSIKSHNINGNNTNSINNSYSNSKTAETSKTSTAAEESRGGGGANMRERMKRLTQLYCGTEMEVQLGKPSTFGREVSAEDRGVSGPPKELGRSLQRHNQTGTTAAVASDKHLADVNFKDEGFDSEGFSNASASQKSSRSSSRDRDSGQVDWSFGQEGGEEGSAPSQVPSARPDQNSRPDDAASNVSSGNHFDRSIESLVSRESSSLLLSLTAVDCTAINESLRAGPRETARVASEQYQQQVTMRSAGRQTPSRTASSSRQNNARATNGSCSSNGSSRSDGGCSNVRTNNLLSFGCKLSTMVSRTASKPASRVTAFADSKKPADKTGSNIKSNSNNNRRATESRASPNLATVKARSLSRQAQETCRAPRDASSKSGHSTVTNPKFQSQSYGTPRASPRSTSVVGAKTLGHKRPPANSTSSSISSDASAKFAHVSRDTKPRSFQLGSLLSSAASSHQKTSASKRSPFSTPPSVMQVPVRKTRTPSSGSLAPRDVVQARGSNFGRQSSSRSTLPSKLLNSSQRSQTRESAAASSAKKMSDGSILSSRLNRPVKPSMAAGSSAAILNRTTNGRQQGSKGVVQL